MKQTMRLLSVLLLAGSFAFSVGFPAGQPVFLPGLPNPLDMLPKLPNPLDALKDMFGQNAVFSIKAAPIAATEQGNIIKKFDLGGCEKHHNSRRPADHPLAVNSDLVKISMDRSIEQALNQEMSHDGSSGNYGENLYSTFSSSNEANWDLCNGALSGWVEGEQKAWEDSIHEENMWNTFYSWGHYSQCMWKKTTEVGCAGALIDNYRFEGNSETWHAVFVTCTYSPAGNMDTGDDAEFRSNVLPLRTA